MHALLHCCHTHTGFHTKSGHIHVDGAGRFESDIELRVIALKVVFHAIPSHKIS